MIPKTEKALEKAYTRCERRFVKIENSLYREYQLMAYEDLDSAKNEDNPRWAITKSYQALFMMCNSILVKRLGLYSKDHNCVIIALLYKDLISKETLDKIHKMLETKRQPKDSFFNQISEIRITRNKYLYLPNILRKVKSPAEQVTEEVRKLIHLLGEQE